MEDSELFKQRKQLRMTDSTGPESRALTSLLKRPKYSVPLAYTLSVASKLVYEEVEIIKYELKRAGFDVDRTFKPIAYKVCIACYTDQLKFTIFMFRTFALSSLRKMMTFYWYSEGKYNILVAMLVLQPSL